LPNGIQRIRSYTTLTATAGGCFTPHQREGSGVYLSVQINKLKEAGYIEVVKQFKDNYPQTTCKITPLGVKAFEEYVQNLQSYLGANRP
jgi:hypothetical protein